MVKKIIIGIVIVALVGLAVWKLAANKKVIDDKKKPVMNANVQIPVNAAKVNFKPVQHQLIKSGNLVPYREANIMSQASGRLVNVNFELGSYVYQGGVVANIDSKMLQLTLEASELQKNKNEKDYNRYKVLLEGDATTESNYQDMKFNYDNTLNKIEQVKKQISDNQIKAPISGQVVNKAVENGEYVNPGSILGSIVDISRLKVNVMVAEKDVYTIKMGQRIKITTDIYPGKMFEGRITFISQKGDAAHNYLVEIQMPNSSATPLKAGTFVYADFTQQSSEHLLMIPRVALVESLKNPYVYVVENGKAVTRKIIVGQESGNDIEVIDGLKEGEIIVTGGQINLSNGSLISVATLQ